MKWFWVLPAVSWGLLPAQVSAIDLPEWNADDERQLARQAPVSLGGGLLPNPNGEPSASVKDEGKAAPPGQTSSGGKPDTPSPGNQGESTLPKAPDFHLKTPELNVGPAPFTEEMTERGPLTPELIKEYFARRPPQFLVDPQHLLTEQKINDLERFLEYHSEESPFDIYLMVFGPNQTVPDEISLAAKHQEWFGGKENAVLVAYRMMEPDKTAIEMGSKVRSSLPESAFQKVFDHCVGEATVASIPADQLERLAIELSIRLYWVSDVLEQQSQGAKLTETQVVEAVTTVTAVAPGEEAPPAKQDGGFSWLPAIIATGAALGVLALIVLLVRMVLGENRIYLFPERRSDVRLGARYSGGSCVSMSFGAPAPESGA